MKPTSRVTQMAPSLKQIKIQYFALLREQRGCSEEKVDTQASTPHELYEELTGKHRFSLPVNRLTVAVNDDFAQWDQQLKNDDVVVFIPPVAGG
jgi:molybdopterin converting factor subunit 1